MIEIVQAGQAGKTALLFDMHRLRARVFKDMLRWDVSVSDDGLEVDKFDLPETVYLLALDKQSRVIGSWRLLPATGPTMLRDVWPHYLETLPMPASADVYEVSRFAVNALEENPRAAAAQAQQSVGEMFCALTEICLKAGIRDIYTMYDDKIAKIIRRIDCHPYKTSAPIPVNGIDCRAGAFKMDAEMQKRLQAATGIAQSLIEGIELPPALARRMS